MTQTAKHLLAILGALLFLGGCQSARYPDPMGLIRQEDISYDR